MQGGKLKGDGEFAFNVVGESYRQGLLSKMAGGRTPDGVNKRVWVWITPEPNNPHDPNAVRIVLDNTTVAYLAADIAPKYKKRMRALGYSSTACCEAVICGGWKRPGGDTGHFGLKLDLIWPIQVDYVVPDV